MSHLRAHRTAGVRPDGVAFEFGQPTARYDLLDNAEVRGFVQPAGPRWPDHRPKQGVKRGQRDDQNS